MLYKRIILCTFHVVRLTTLLEHGSTLEHLAYLGYLYHHDSTLSAIQGSEVVLRYLWRLLEVTLFWTFYSVFS